MATKDGFVRLPNWVIDDNTLSLYEMSIYVVLLRYRDHKTGRCFPGMGTIAKGARVSRDTVKRTIPALEAKGMITVTKRREGTKNLPNMYWVSTEPPKVGAHSTQVGAASTQGVGAGSTSNKTYENKTHEEDMRRTSLKFAAPSFTHALSTDKQVDYLNDLYIFLTEETADQRTRTNWEQLDMTQASNLIRTFWKQMDRGRGGMWESPVDEDHPAYEHLSPMGKEWIYNGCTPDAIGAA